MKPQHLRSETRHADRVFMAEFVHDLARHYGLISTLRIEAERTAAAITSGHGLGVTIEFRRRTPQAQPNTFVLSWHGDVKLHPGFAQSVNPHHFRKATDVVIGFDPLIELLHARFKAIQSGAAFQQNPEDLCTAHPTAGHNWQLHPETKIHHCADCGQPEY